jgi:hypothetical protein
MLSSQGGSKEQYTKCPPIGIYFTHANKYINILFTKLRSHNSNYTEHNFGPSLWASFSVDLISVASTEKENWLYTINGKGGNYFKKDNA